MAAAINVCVNVCGVCLAEVVTVFFSHTNVLAFYDSWHFIKIAKKFLFSCDFRLEFYCSTSSFVFISYFNKTPIVPHRK